MGDHPGKHGKARDQRRMDVDDAVRILRRGVPGEDAEVPGKDDHVDVVLRKDLPEFLKAHIFVESFYSLKKFIELRHMIPPHPLL